MSNAGVWVFFYGSYMSLDVLKEVGLAPERWETAKLAGYEIRIEPRANLVPSERDIVHGIVAIATHDELDRLYAHARDILGEVYLPQPVLVETGEGAWRPALCYIAPEMELRPAEDDYIDRIVRPARELEFPDWYVERIESFRPR